jgi:glyoxylase-like metal-dependent hydrolase (beta-lactamase superfamily II)/rhodanese-related sulfurtransferase
MILSQYYLGCLSQASYLVADERTGRAVIVDPRRDVDDYIQDVRRLGLRLELVVLTHIHADFVSGHLELRERTGCRICLGARARADYPFDPLRDGDVIALGSVSLEVRETPGHTPESICVVVYDRARAPTGPQAVLTGDTLFVGDVGRPDLAASGGGASAPSMARELYRSLHEKLLTLPDETLVYPGHGPGSMCGKSLGPETSTTIGDQRRRNYALQPMSEAAFVRLVTAGQPEPPPYFVHDAAFNRRHHEPLWQALEHGMRPLSVARISEVVASGAQLLDVREPDPFAAAHLVGSLNIGLSGRFASWAGTLLDRERPIAIVSEPGREQEAAIRLGRIGMDELVGYLEGGAGAIAERPDLVARSARLSPCEFRNLVGCALVLDVRTAAERTRLPIEESVHLPLAELPLGVGRLPRGEEIVVVCASGYRSSMAASLLRREGFDRVRDLAGGLAAWSSAVEALPAG